MTRGSTTTRTRHPASTWDRRTRSAEPVRSGRGAVNIANGQTCTRPSSAAMAISCGDPLLVEPELALRTLTQQLPPLGSAAAVLYPVRRSLRP